MKTHKELNFSSIELRKNKVILTYYYGKKKMVVKGDYKDLELLHFKGLVENKSNDSLPQKIKSEIFIGTCSDKQGKKL